MFDRLHTGMSPERSDMLSHLCCGAAPSGGVSKYSLITAGCGVCTAAATENLRDHAVERNTHLNSRACPSQGPWATSRPLQLFVWLKNTFWWYVCWIYVKNDLSIYFSWTSYILARFKYSCLCVRLQITTKLHLREKCNLKTNSRAQR